MYRVAEHITSMWALAAFAAAALVHLVYVFNRRRSRAGVPALAWLVLVLLVAIPTTAAVLMSVLRPRGDVYRVRVTVLQPSGVPTGTAKIWSSVGGEKKDVAAGSEFDIPASEVPQDGVVTLYAADSREIQTGKAVLHLTKDLHPTKIITLDANANAIVAGIVSDKANHQTISGALVTVGLESVPTDENGRFSLATHTAAGEPIVLHVEKVGYQVLNQPGLAGNTSEYVSLSRETAMRKP